MVLILNQVSVLGMQTLLYILEILEWQGHPNIHAFIIIVKFQNG